MTEEQDYPDGFLILEDDWEYSKRCSLCATLEQREGRTVYDGAWIFPGSKCERCGIEYQGKVRDESGEIVALWAHK